MSDQAEVRPVAIVAGVRVRLARRPSYGGGSTRGAKRDQARIVSTVNDGARQPSQPRAATAPRRATR